MTPIVYEPGDQIVTPGTTYRVSRVLGRGGMGAVYEAIDKNLNRPVVVKLASEAVAEVAHARDRFNREARAMAQIRHRNVVHVTLLGSVEDEARTPFYVMERLDGQSLRAILVHKKTGLRIDHAINVAIQILWGLDAIHERGIVHRDIKPDNVLLHRNEGGETVATIIDFGIMLLLADGARPTDMACTLSYAAPEQIRSGELGPWTDIYALGLVLFEMLTGRKPYRGYGLDVASVVARSEIEAPTIDTLGAFPPALSKLVARALALDPKDRPPNALAFIRELEKLENAFVGLDLHEAVTDQALNGMNEPLVEAATGARTITQADLANPTDPDGDIPVWMQALRSKHKKEAILGYAEGEAPAGMTTDTEPLARPYSLNDTEPSPQMAHVVATTVPLAPPRRPSGAPPSGGPSPISARGAAVTEPPREALEEPSAELLYVETSLPDLDKLKAAVERERRQIEAARAVKAVEAKKKEREARLPNDPPKARRRSGRPRGSKKAPARDRVLVFCVVLSLVLLGGAFMIRWMGLMPGGARSTTEAR